MRLLQVSDYKQSAHTARRKPPAAVTYWRGISCFICWSALLIGARFAIGSDGPPFPRIANVYGTTLTADGARVSGQLYSLKDLARCDLLIGVHPAGYGPAGREMFRQQLTSLKKLNPHLKALHFACSAPYLHKKPTDEMVARREAGKPFPWLLQTNGDLIAGWPGTYMLNLTSPRVLEWLAQTTVPPIREHGYDGVFIDCMGPHFDTWACEIATGRDYTVDHDGDGKDDDRAELAKLWTRAKAVLARRSRELIGDAPIFMANQAHLSLKEQMNGIYLEDYVDGVLDGRIDWEQMLELYRDWTKTPHQPNVTVLGCSSGVEPPFEGYKLSDEERAEYFAEGRPRLDRMRFGLTTTLMDDGYYSYDLHTRWRGQLWWYPEYDAPLGYPIEPCHRESDGTWRRQFQGGLVVVNPTNWDVAVGLGDDYRDVSSGRTGRQFLVPRLDGRIFVPVTLSVATGELADPSQVLTCSGPQGVAERDDILVLRDGRGLALLLNQAGNIQSLCFRGQELITSLRSVIVRDDRWKNFAAEDCQHCVTGDGALVFKGKRSFAQQEIAFTQTLRLDDGKLALEYQYTALTPLELKTFRQAMNLAPRRFGGTTLRWDAGNVTLPKRMSDDPNLANGINTATLPLDDGSELTIQLPQTGHLADERFYHGHGYLLAFHPIAGKIEAGKTWSYSIEIAIKK